MTNADNGVVLQLLGVEHLGEIERVMQSAFDPRYGEAWTSGQVLATMALPGYHLQGACLSDSPSTLVGFAISRSVGWESELLLLGVDADHRRYGIGSALMQSWLSHCREQQVERAFLEMREDNLARGLYERCGFTDIARRKAYYRGHDGIVRDAITMQNNLV